MFVFLKDIIMEALDDDLEKGWSYYPGNDNLFFKIKMDELSSKLDVKYAEIFHHICCLILLFESKQARPDI